MRRPVNPIVRFAVERRVTMAMAVLGVAVLGWLSLTRLPLEFLPSFSGSHISVLAPYASSSPAETERLIVRPLEDSLGTINGVESLTASATAGQGMVRLAFVAGTDMDLAAVDVRDRVDRVRALLPDDLERVQILRFQTTDRPVLSFQVSAPWPLDEMYRFVDETVVQRIQRIEGVADVTVRGTQTRQVQVNLDPDRLAAHGIDVRDVATVIRANHTAVSAGWLRDGSLAYQVRVDGKLKTLDEIRNLPLADGTLALGDVAEVSMDYPERERYSFLNGRESVSVHIFKTSTANLLAVIDRVRAELDDLQAQSEASGLDVNVYRDDSEDVRKGLAELRSTGLLGGGLAIFFMALFIRRVRTTLLVAVAIPVSVIMTFVIMYLARQAGWTALTLNIMSMMGLMLAIGMLVDSSIVVIESIFRRRQEHREDARTATLLGASEVVLPITASTLTTVCVFMPMVFLPTGGRFSIFMGNIGLTVVIVMVAALVVAVTVVPMVAARLLERERTEGVAAFERTHTVYERCIRFMLRHRLIFVGAVVLVLVLSWNLYQGIGRSFSPPSFERQINIQVDTPSDYSIDQKRRLFDRLYDVIDAHREELEVVTVTHSFATGGGRMRGPMGGNRFDIFLTDEKDSVRDTAEIREQLEALLPTEPGVQLSMSRSMRGRGGAGTGVELRLQGDRMEILEELATRVVDRLSAVAGLTSVDTTLESGTEEARLRPNADRVLQAGLSSQDVARSVSSALSERPVSYLEVEDQELDVVVQYRPDERQTLDQLERLPVGGRHSGITIGAVGEFEIQPGARSIERENRRAVLGITADTDSSMPSFMAERAAKMAVEQVQLPAGYSIEEGEDWRMGREDTESATFMLLFALVLVYMVMASLFESFAQPFTIMFSVPFAFIGVGVIMKLTGQPRSQMADIGLIILAGIVVNNAIVLVDHINQLRRAGFGRTESIVIGGRHRLRPILMTAMTTILGLSPMVAPFFLPQVFGAIEGRAAFWAPVGLVILSGLVTSTFLTLTVIPVVYSLVDDLTVFTRRVAAEVMR